MTFVNINLPLYFILIVWLRFVSHLLNYYLLTYLLTYHAAHCDKRRRNKNTETVKYAEHKVKRLGSFLYNGRLNEEGQLLKSSSGAGKVFQQ